MGTATRVEELSPALLGERRDEARTSCHIRVVIESGQRSFECVVWDVSPSGAYMECGAPLAEGQRIRIHVPFAPVLHPKGLRAEVRWVLRGPKGQAIGAGIRFDKMRPADSRAWRRYVGSLR